MWKNGQYHCVCGTIFGKNLLNESPYLLVSQHLETCQVHQEKKYQNHLDWEKNTLDSSDN